MNEAGLAPARHRLSVDDYHRMAETGILAADARIELIDGDLIDMAPIGQEHAASVGRLAQALFMACAGRAIVWRQNPILLDDASEPQPDLAILRPRDDFYARGTRPGPADTLLVVEISDTSLRYDRGVKLALYARAGIGEVWIVDLQHGVLEACSEPAGAAYQSMLTHAAGPQVALRLARRRSW